MTETIFWIIWYASGIVGALIYNSFMNYESKLVEMSEKMKPVTIIFKQLQIIIDDELGHNQNNNVKKVLSSVLERLKDSIGDTIIEE